MNISLFKNRLDWILCAEKITNVGLLGADSKTNVKGISELLSDCFACLGTQVKDWPDTQIWKIHKVGQTLYTIPHICHLFYKF